MVHDFSKGCEDQDTGEDLQLVPSACVEELLMSFLQDQMKNTRRNTMKPFLQLTNSDIRKHSGVQV